MSISSTLVPALPVARHTDRLVGMGGTGRPALGEKSEVILPVRACDDVPRRRAILSRAARTWARSTGRVRNSTAPARITRITKSADTGGAVANSTHSG